MGNANNHGRISFVCLILPHFWNSADLNKMQPIFLSIQISVICMLFLLFLAPICAWWLSNTQSRIAIIVESFLNLPLILPPTVLGFYLLLLFGKNGPMWFLHLAFSFHGLVVTAIIYSFPFALQPLFGF